MDVSPNPWETDPVVAPSVAPPVADPGFTGVIPGVPKPTAPKTTFKTLSPEEVKAHGLNPDFAYQQSSEGEIKQIGKLPDQNDTQAKTQSAMDSTRDLLQSIERARGLVSNWSTGLGGAVGKLYPGSDQANQLDTIVHQELRGNIFKNWVAQLKAQSATGTSGIGRIMQSEIPLVTGSLGALDPVKMGRQGTLDSFDQIENRVLRSAALLNNENPDDPKVLQKYRKQFIPAAKTNNDPTPPGSSGSGAGPGDDGSGDGGGGDGPPGMSDLSPDQKQAYTAFLAANPKPSGDQVGAFLTKLTGKTVTNGDDIAKAISLGQGVSTTVEDKTRQQKVQQRIAGEDKLGLNESPAATLLKQGATLNLSDEAAGVGGALSNVIASPFTGKFDPVGSYTLGRDVERQRIADARQQLGYGGTALEVAGALASANPEAAAAALTPRAAAVAAGKAGAVGGALSGFGAGEGTSQSTGGAVVGAAAGGALGRYGGTVVNKVLPRGLQPPQGMAPELADAAKAENVDLIQPMVDPAARPKFGALESDPTAQPIVRGGADNVRGQIEARVGALGGDGNVVEDPGSVVQNAGRRFIQRSKGVANTLYNRAQSLAGDQRFVPHNAIGQVESELAALQKNPETNAGEINFLEGLHSDLAAPGGKTVEELRQLRTSLRGRVNEQNLGATQAEARAMRAMDATQQDVAQNVPDAASAYQRADTYYRERQTHIDDVIKRITGGNVGPDNFQVSSDAAFQRLKSMASPGGDGRRFAALMRDLDPNERQDIAATIAQGLGRRAPDEPFSAALFVSQTRKLSPSARRTIFGPDGAQSIDNLRLLSQKLTDAGGDINRSRSTTVANRMSPIRTAAKTFIASITGLGPAAAGYAAGGAEGSAIGLATTAAGMAAAKGGKVLSARAMVNPRVSRWLAEFADVSTPQQAQQATRKLGVIIAREPALARELQPVYAFLNDRVALPLAANPDQSGGGNDQQQ